MSNGTSQGLFIIVAVVIFGIFVGISSLLFQSSLKPKLMNIFDKSFENILEVKEIYKINEEAKTPIFVEVVPYLNGYLITRSGISENSLGNGDKEKMTGDLIFPDFLNGKPILSIGVKAFENAGFEGKIKLPKELKRIEATAFWRVPFTGTLNIPESVEYIGTGAFELAKFQGEFKPPEKLKIINQFAFKESLFTGEFKMNPQATHIGAYAFRFSKFTGTFDYPELIFLGGSAFEKSLFSGDLNLPVLKTLGGNDNAYSLDNFRYGETFKSSSFSNVFVNSNVQIFGKENIKMDIGGFWNENF